MEQSWKMFVVTFTTSFHHCLRSYCIFGFLQHSTPKVCYSSLYQALTLFNCISVIWNLTFAKSKINFKPQDSCHHCPIRKILFVPDSKTCSFPKILQLYFIFILLILSCVSKTKPQSFVSCMLIMISSSSLFLSYSHK